MMMTFRDTQAPAPPSKPRPLLLTHPTILLQLLDTGMTSTPLLNFQKYRITMYSRPV